MKDSKPIYAFTAACLCVWAGCGHRGDNDAQDREAGRSTASHEHSPEGVVVLPRAVQHQMGLTTELLEIQSVSREVKAYGQVMEPQPLVALLAELTSARTELELSTREWQRATVLYEPPQNTSLRALETAEAAMKRDQVAVEAVRLKLVAEWGSSLAGRDDLTGFARSLTTLASAMVRVHLSAGQHLDSPPLGARITALGQESQSVLAKPLGPVPKVDPDLQGQGYFFLVESNSMLLTPGAAVTAQLELGGPPVTGVVVPDHAIVLHEKHPWVYLQTNDITFTRQQVTLNHPLENGWLITGTLKPGDHLVVDGAQMLLSEESRSKIQVGD